MSVNRIGVIYYFRLSALFVICFIIVLFSFLFIETSQADPVVKRINNTIDSGQSAENDTKNSTPARLLWKWSVLPEPDTELLCFVSNVVVAVNNNDLGALEKLTSNGILAKMNEDQLTTFRGLYLSGMASYTISEKYEVECYSADTETLKQLENKWRTVWPIMPEIEVRIQYWTTSDSGKTVSFFAEKTVNSWKLILPIPCEEAIEYYIKEAQTSSEEK